MYKAYLASSFAYNTLETGNANSALALVTDLRKVVNHPDLIFNH